MVAEDAGAAADDAAVGEEPVHADVVGFGGDGIADNLPVVAEADFDGVGVGVVEQDVVVAFAVSDAHALFVEGEAGDEEKCDGFGGD